MIISIILNGFLLVLPAHLAFFVATHLRVSVAL